MAHRLAQKKGQSVLALYSKGATHTGIARRFNVARSTISRVLKHTPPGKGDDEGGTVYAGARVTGEELNAFDVVISRISTHTRSDAIRAFIASPAGFYHPDADLEEGVGRFTAQITGIATNVNTLTRNLNADRRRGKTPRLTERAARLLEELRALLQDLKPAIAQMQHRRAGQTADVFRQIIAGGKHVR